MNKLFRLIWLLSLIAYERRWKILISIAGLALFIAIVLVLIGPHTGIGWLYY